MMQSQYQSSSRLRETGVYYIVDLELSVTVGRMAD